MALSIKLAVAGTREVKNRETGKMELKETKGGTVCVYGLNAQFPVALYPNQWKELALYMPAILAKIDEWEAGGSIQPRELVQKTAGGERTVLVPVNPLVAAYAQAKGISADEAERILKSQGITL